MFLKFAISAQLCALLSLILIQQISSIQASHHSNYDPEQQDGIPVFSARSISDPTDDWTSSGTSNNMQPAQRRQADSDLDDGLEDEDEDEYKSGSSPQESIENPSYGESKRAARDGEEIEDFFDRHLGPPQETTSADESSANVIRQDVPAIDPDTDDQFEAAASSPLSNIFHSLLSHTHGDHKHKRPLLQIATGGSSESESEPSKTSVKENQIAPSNAIQSSKSLLSLAAPNTIKSSQSVQSFVESAPIGLAFTPIAASSHQVSQDQAEHDSQQDQNDVSPPNSGVREIYIGRRPIVMNYLQQAYGPQQQPGYSAAGSSNVWRGSPTNQRNRHVVYEQDQANDYARYPIAASYAYQRNQPNVAAASTPDGTSEDEQTVTYGLSFGGGGGATADESSSNGPITDATQADDQASQSAEADEHQQQQQDQSYMQQPQGYVPYNTRYTTSSTRAHNNYYQQYNNDPAYYRQANLKMIPQQQMVVQQHHRQYYQPVHYAQQQTRAGSTRYHRDPSESMNMRLAVPRQQHFAAHQQVSGDAQYR